MRQDFKNSAITALELLDPEVESVISDAKYKTRPYRAKELTIYLQAYDFLKGAGVSEDSLSCARDALQTFARKNTSNAFAIKLNFLIHVG